ncbi:hypothetical protein [Photobacterium phosphoreum]|uniref:hypothetical protein n=1 Tax=Photobacterium phosphoreum TaxID=659 RepID=UPI0039B0474F
MNTPSIITTIEGGSVTCKNITGNSSVPPQDLILLLTDLKNVINDTSKITIKNDELIKALNELNHTLSSTPSGSLYEIIIGAFFSVLAAFVFNYLYWKSNERKEKRYTYVIEAKNSLQDFETNATDYWSTDYLSKNNKSTSIQEAKIKANHALLLNTYKQIKQLLSRSQKQNDQHLKIDIELSKLYDIATGGNFESSTRKANKKTVSSIIRHCTRIKTMLSNLDN